MCSLRVNAFCCLSSPVLHGDSNKPGMCARFVYENVHKKRLLCECEGAAGWGDGKDISELADVDFGVLAICFSN